MFRTIPHDFVLDAVPSLLLHQAMERDAPGGGEDVTRSEEDVVDACWDLLLHGVLRRGSRTSAE